MSRTLLTIIGLVAFGAIFIVIFLFVNSINPPATEVYIATRDLLPGEALVLEDLAVVAVPAQGLEVSYVTEDNADLYNNTEVVNQIYAGEFIPISALLSVNNPVSLSRIALSISDPEHIAIVLPIDPETSPQNIVTGDFVDVTIAVGSGSLLAGSFDTVPEPEGVNDFYFQAQAADLTAIPTLESPFLPTPELTPTAPQPITLPVAKTVSVRARVMQVNYLLIVQPSTTNAEPRIQRGDIQSLVLEVPRETQEIISFGVANGIVRVSVLHPNVADEEFGTAGMSWDDMVAFFRWERDQWAAAQPGNGIEYAPGSSSLLLTLQATQRVTSPPPIIATPTVTPEQAAGEITPTASPTP
ncbi:MAG: hypothetical protein DWQ07_17420 [Chloroflexi bacterium]|nr:MAG: hypothetical protein DWQ07_17420 [Chloroflexota bacterium]MBL1195186.1 hypothetical protein [Chloroflexota bacterium]NOH12470.1 SAF domain-containing protein [Chloroflexota bacterium]